MIAKLLKKELALCLHPTTPLMIALSALTLTPNYPYTLIYFFLTLGIFFICLTGRENNDITFTMTLPVAKRDIVSGRFLLVILLELAQMLCALGMILLRRLLPLGENAAGMNANLSLLGEGFLFYGVFHLVFFPSYYKNVEKVGISFLKSSAALFILVILDIVCSYALPFSRDVLDTPDPAHMGEKLVFLLCCLLIGIVLTFAAWRISQRRFQKQDIR